MEYHEIENLLNRYIEGESSLKEEALLKEYFSQPDLPPEQREMQEMFRYFVFAEKEAAPDFNIADELNAIIENESVRKSGSRLRLLYAWVGSAAAVLIISFGIYHFIEKPETVLKDTYKDPKLAYLETKRALLMVSNVMNRNTANLKYLAKVDESFNHMNKISEIDKVFNSVKK